MFVINHPLCLVTDPSSHIYPIPFVSRSLDWLAWLGLARLASAWLVSSAAATRTATTPKQAYKTIVAPLRAAPARQDNQGIDSQMELDIFVMMDL